MLAYGAWGLGGAAVAAGLAKLGLRFRNTMQLRRAAPRRLLATRHRLWRDPGVLRSAHLRFGPGGARGVPVPPFVFVQEHFAGSQPCVGVRDARGRLWRVKWGHEVRPESFAVRFAHACGYFAEVTHYLEEGAIEGASGLTRARACIGEDHRFREARFELENPHVRMLFGEHGWSWDDNPFIGTPQLSGLKIVTMLLSNWDTKDRRDVARGSNTAIFEQRVSAFGREARYLITDWGGAMGKWGANVISRGRWDPDGFEAQTPHFVTGVKDGIVQFGYVGQRTADVAYHIPVDHVAWFYGYAKQLTEPLLREALLASGATDEEATRFARALRERIRQLGQVSNSQGDLGVPDSQGDLGISDSQGDLGDQGGSPSPNSLISLRTKDQNRQLARYSLVSGWLVRMARTISTGIRPFCRIVSWNCTSVIVFDATRSRCRVLNCRPPSM